MKSIRYSAAMFALLAAVSFNAAPSHALTDAGAVNKIGGALFNQTAEERAVSNIEGAIAQKQLAKEKLQAQLLGSGAGLGAFDGAVADAQRGADSLERALFDQGQSMTAEQYQTTLNEFNRAQSRVVALKREAVWEKHRQDRILREIERKDNDIVKLGDKLALAKSLAAGSRLDAVADAATDVAIAKARDEAALQRRAEQNARAAATTIKNRAYTAAREAARDAQRRTSVGYVYESIERKSGTYRPAVPYSRASGTARDRQSANSEFALDFGGGQFQ